jgi:LPS O-antigen subunit length determinant protein (WzzB/FepE family)
MIEEEQIENLSKKLGIEQDRVEKIKSLDAATLKIKDKDSYIISITAELVDPALIKELSKNIVAYLNSTPYVRERLDLEKERLVHLRIETQSKLNEIEELKDFVVNQIKSGKFKDLGFSPVALDREVIDLKQRLKDLDKRITLLRGFEISVEPVVSVKPVKPKRTLYVATAGIVSLFIAVFLAFFLEWVRNRKND